MFQKICRFEQISKETANVKLCQLFIIAFWMALSGCASAQKNPVELWTCSLAWSPQEELLQLLSLLEVKHDGSLDSIVKTTQNEWLRPKGKERWEVQGLHEDKRAEIEPLLLKMGFIETVHASQMQYDYGVILGSYAPNVRTRLQFLMDEWNRGVRFRQLVFLGGERFVDETQDQLKSFLPNKPKTETDVMKLIFAEAKLPKEMQKLEVVFVDAPAKKKPDGGMERPNTGDTIHTWLANAPKPGHVLAVSTQPFVQYQDAVLKTLLPRSFQVETVGAKAQKRVPVAVWLDNLARYLYQQRERFRN